jgi:hypothetical protein
MGKRFESYKEYKQQESVLLAKIISQLREDSPIEIGIMAVFKAMAEECENNDPSMYEFSKKFYNDEFVKKRTHGDLAAFIGYLVGILGSSINVDRKEQGDLT